MPPANSPITGTPRRTDSPTIPRTPSPNFQSILREIGSPVQDLASTLTVQAEDDAEAENLSFLRTPVEPPDEALRETLTEQLRSHSRRSMLHRWNSSGDGNGRETQGSGRRSSHLQPPPENTSASGHARLRQTSRESRSGSQHYFGSLPEPHDRSISQAYGDRVPNQQSLYDWAPTTEAGDEDELEDIVAELREQQPNTHPEILRVLGRVHMDADREARSVPSSRFAQRSTPPPPPNHQEPPSLRSAAILQSVRRNHRFSARSRDLMQRYVVDRERALQENDEQDRSNASRYLRAAASANDSNRYEFNRLAWQASQRPSEHVPSHSEMVDYLQPRYTHESNTPEKPSDFEKVIQHLHSRRSSDLDLQSTATSKENALPSQSVLRKIPILPPPSTSFLAPGMIFSGFQQASHLHPMSSSSTTLHRLASQHNSRGPYPEPTTQRPSPNTEPPRPWLARNLTMTPPSLSTSSTPALTHANPNANPNPNPNNHDRWTVKVAVHQVDYDTMTLKGTMEAFNVAPQQQASTADNKTFSTYLEGELIDFQKHTLLTESFRATSYIDSTYWRKLDPFAAMTDSEIARNLLNPDWVNKELLSKYVLMRWKERCFVEQTMTSAAGVRRGAVPRGAGAQHDSLPTPPPYHGNSTASFLSGADGNGFGLSISGFYYVSLRRKDGRCEGLYFDPQSSPYQHLELRPETGRWSQGAWEFR